MRSTFNADRYISASVRRLPSRSRSTFLLSLDRRSRGRRIALPGDCSLISDASRELHLALCTVASTARERSRSRRSTTFIMKAGARDLRL